MNRKEMLSKAGAIALGITLATSPTLADEINRRNFPDTTSGNLTEQPYISHPRLYMETGIGKTKTFENIVVNEGEYLIVGGVIVNGVDGGVYQGFGPGIYEKIVATDGFISVADKVFAKDEFDFRVKQAEEYNWAHGTIDRGPIPTE